MSSRETEEFGQLSWVPPNSEDQLALGMKLITHAYTTRYTTLEKEIALLSSRVKELSTQLRESEDRATESELVLQELRDKNGRLVEDNEKMTSALRKLKLENTRLQSLTNNIKSTIDANNSQIISEPENTPIAQPQHDKNT